MMCIPYSACLVLFYLSYFDFSCFFAVRSLEYVGRATVFMYCEAQDSGGF